MDIANWWPNLSDETREWLASNNGNAMTPEILAEIVAAGGPELSEPAWGEQSDPSGTYLPDVAVDWIEEKTNTE
jgi:hypothetical protein